MNKIKDAYWNGLCILSDFIVLFFFMGLAHFLVVMSIGAFGGFAPAGSEKAISNGIENMIQIGALILYAPLIAHYTLRNRIGCNPQEESTIDLTNRK